GHSFREIVQDFSYRQSVSRIRLKGINKNSLGSLGKPIRKERFECLDCGHAEKVAIPANATGAYEDSSCIFILKECDAKRLLRGVPERESFRNEVVKDLIFAALFERHCDRKQRQIERQLFFGHLRHPSKQKARPRFSVEPNMGNGPSALRRVSIV